MPNLTRILLPTLLLWRLSYVKLVLTYLWDGPNK